MATSSLEMSELISNQNRTSHLALPDIKPITDARKYVSDSKNFNGSVEKATEFLAGQEKQCLDVIQLLKEEVHSKLAALHKVKDDLLALQRQLAQPTDSKFDKVLVKFTDETEMNECEVPDALARYSIKMSSLYSEILGLDSDVDYVSYLASVARVNKDFVGKVNSKTPKIRL
ncbi:uncharacterized protein LOC117568824 [Drosophila albomicans]|uniref:Uncharacterized protein LOC117568824 n=1 Tax=Drosophila albomicans TaxID=7291 RepID=A0A6P8WPF2_DROAB|nr:uncharacterized protein LOC117568824 [Drosophila albomicans]